MSVGRLFQMLGAEMRKARSPYYVLVRVTSTNGLNDDLSVQVGKNHDLLLLFLLLLYWRLQDAAVHSFNSISLQFVCMATYNINKLMEHIAYQLFQ